jgi:hypothetical protein
VRGCQPFNINNLKLARFNEIFHFLIEMLADRGWTTANFCRLPMCRIRCIARSRLRNRRKSSAMAA